MDRKWVGRPRWTLAQGRPEILNTDQGSQVTSQAYTSCVLDHGIPLSMDGRGRVVDNIIIERLWRSVKYEEVYLHDYADLHEAERRLDWYLGFYNREGPHQGLDGMPPWALYTELPPCPVSG